MVRTKLNSTAAATNRKAEILKEATKIFAEKGYEVASLDEVANNLGVTKASFYYYFRSKNDILREIIGEAVREMKTAVDIGETKLTSVQKLHELIRILVKNNTYSQERAKIITEQTDNLPMRNRETIKRRKKEVDTVLQKILQDGVSEGIFDIKDVQIASYAIIGLCGWAYHWYKPDRRLGSEQIAELFIDFVDHGYLKR